MTHKQKITKAFKRLEKLGYFTAQDFWCCQSCAWNALSDGDAEKVVFYHDQDGESFGTDGNLENILHLAWAGNAKEICDILTDNGLEVSHDGASDTRIEVLP